MKKIMVVFTGGTIGSTSQGSSINVNHDGSYMIIDKYKEQNDTSVVFDTMQPLNILSENLIADQWLTLAEHIKSIPQEQYEGIIITHGSDTLAYSAAMLSYLLADTSIPIVLIASNYPLEDNRANGMRNFSEAVAWILQDAPRGVFVVYENNKKECVVYLGTRIMQCETFTDQFRSPYELTLGKLTNGILELVADTRNPSMAQLATRQASCLPNLEQLHSLQQQQILYMKPYPGLNYDMYQWSHDKKPIAVVHDLYHSGTACSIENGPYSLPQFIRRCKAEGITVYLTPVKDAAEAKYASTAVLVDAGAILLEGISPEALITKLMLLHGLLEPDEVELKVKQSLYYEFHELN